MVNHIWRVKHAYVYVHSKRQVKSFSYCRRPMMKKNSYKIIITFLFSIFTPWFWNLQGSSSIGESSNVPTQEGNIRIQKIALIVSYAQVAGKQKRVMSFGDSTNLARYGPADPPWAHRSFTFFGNQTSACTPEKPGPRISAPIFLLDFDFEAQIQKTVQTRLISATYWPTDRYTEEGYIYSERQRESIHTHIETLASGAF